jgi:lipocalin
MTFNIKKYMGVWYELIHYPSFFQRNDNYNTKAEYKLINGMVDITNSTLVQGKLVKSKGKGKLIDDFILRVDFAPPEVSKLAQTGQFKPANIPQSTEPNYVIDHIWVDDDDNYQYAVVTDLHRNALYVLSRTTRPPLKDYTKIMNYVLQFYDRDRLVQTPHY